jgi:hypothetical protein
MGSVKRGNEVASLLTPLSFASGACLKVLSEGDWLAGPLVCEAGAAGKLGA